MNHPCSIPSHEGKNVTMVCSNLKCKGKRRLMCLRCLLEEHPDCIKHVLEIENVLKGDILLNLNWLKHEEIKTAVKLINKHNVSNQVQVIETSEKRVEEEFAKIKVDLCKKVDDAKERVIKNLKERQSNDWQLNLKSFTKRMEEFYGFDTLAGIIESIKGNNQNDIETVNLVLESFFDSLNDKKVGSDLELENKSKALGKYLKDVLELDSVLFERARKNVDFSLFEHYLKGSAAWTWNADNKAPGIELSEGNMKAKKNSAQGFGAVGTVEMNSGVHRWELDIASANGDAYWIALGIVDKNVLAGQNCINLNYGTTVGFSTDGLMYQMALQKAPEGGWDNKTYVCELDMDQGNFTISCNGQIICKNNASLAGKTMLPYIYLWTAGDRATLRVL